jgi:cytoskeletal protein RodZ
MLMVIAPTDDFGLTLRTTREAAGRTLREVADVTKLGVRTLEALERNQVERLPKGIFRRAIVRAYAQEVGLDPEATLKAFLRRFPDDLPPPGGARKAIVDTPAGRRSWPAPLIMGVLLGLVAVLMLVVYLLWPRESAAASGAASLAAGAVAERPAALRLG